MKQFLFARWCNVRKAYVPWLTKVTCAVYGLVFLGIAFIAEHLGGVLQASLTIFAAVGGPVLGVFTLGMFTTFANEAVSIDLIIYLCGVLSQRYHVLEE